jgi:hypothetical protein
MLLGVCYAIETPLPGKIRVTELVGLILAPKIIYDYFKSESPRKRLVNNILILISIAMLWQLVVDLFIHNRPLTKTFDYFATIVLFVSNALTFGNIFTRRIEMLVPFLIGSAVGHAALLKTYNMNVRSIQQEYWDLVVASWGGPLLLAGLIVFCPRSRIKQAIAASVYAMAAAFYGARSHGLCILLGTSIPFISHFSQAYMRVFFATSTYKFLILFTVIVYILGITYVVAGQHNLLTEKTVVQLEKVKNPFNPVDLIRSGREGIFRGLEAMFIRPIEGYGSLAYARHFSRSRAYETGENYVHSGLVESGVYGGLISFFCWFGVALQIFRLRPLAVVESVDKNVFETVGCIAMMLALWTLIFSPLVSLRVYAGIFFAIQLACHSRVFGYSR